jgi:hypothetical protein
MLLLAHFQQLYIVSDDNDSQQCIIMRCLLHVHKRNAYERDGACVSFSTRFSSRDVVDEYRLRLVLHRGNISS